jgi:DNA polymerase IV
MMRKIIHVDMDAFYASVEQRDNPAYLGKPLVVGGSPGQRGVVAAASYEARQYGIHSAMSSRIAIKKCPNLIFAHPRFDVYRAVSKQIHDIFARYTDVIEPVALDEAYLDVTQNKLGKPYASTIAKLIRANIFEETNLTASAGVSINKFLAKMASGINKPNGMTVILPENAEAFVETLPIEKFHGIGKVTATKMHSLGIKNGADLKQLSLQYLIKNFGKAGEYYYNIARAQDERRVEANRIRKSIGAETSFATDLSDEKSTIAELQEIVNLLKQRVDECQAFGRTITLKIKYSNYKQITRSKTLLAPINDLETIGALAVELLNSIDLSGQSIRLLGLSLSNLDNKPQIIQLPLFELKM